MPERGSLLKRPVPGAVRPQTREGRSRRHRHDTPVGGNHLPEEFVTDAHDDGTTPTLALTSQSKHALAEDLFPTRAAKERRGHEQTDLRPRASPTANRRCRNEGWNGDHDEALRVRVGPRSTVRRRWSRQYAEQ